MKNPDPDHQIQLPASLGSPSVSFGDAADPSRADDTLRREKSRQQDLRAGLRFGALVGLVVGAPVGSACCWLAGSIDYVWQAAPIGAAIGSLLGAIIGLMERKVRGELVRPDIATIICVVFGLLPALLILLGGIGTLRGRFSGYLFLGTAAAGPMGGLLIGAMLDRAYEERLKKSWGAALGFGAAGVAVCMAIVFLLAWAAIRADPKDVAPKARTLILQNWEKNPNLQGATIQSVILVYKGDNVYTGFVDATIEGEAERLSLRVVYEDGIVELELKPRKE